MTNAEKKAAKKCDIKDFITKFTNPKYKTNNRKQLDEVIDYLARYGMNGSKVECTFDELLLTAKNVLLSQAAEQHLDELNTNAYDYLGNLNLQEEYDLKKFILRPMNTIKDKFADFDVSRKIKNEKDPDKIKYYKDLEANAKRIGNLIKDYTDEINDATKVNTCNEVLNRIQQKLPETTKNLDQALDNNRGGVFERMFSTTSRQYSNFKAAFKDFRNVNSVYLGDTNHLEKETKAYLHHVIPDFKTTDDIPTPEQFAKLSGTQKGRAAFCINVLRSIKETREIEPLKDNVTRALKGEFEYHGQPMIIEHNEKNSFQEHINDDLNKSSEINIQQHNNFEDNKNDLDNNLDESQLEDAELFNQLTK